MIGNIFAIGCIVGAVGVVALAIMLWYDLRHDRKCVVTK